MNRRFFPSASKFGSVKAACSTLDPLATILEQLLGFLGNDEKFEFVWEKLLCVAALGFAAGRSEGVDIEEQDEW